MAEERLDSLAQDLASLEFRHGVERGFWRLIERVGFRVYIECFAWNDDTYVLELTCDRYREEPSLGKFVDPVTRARSSEAWPRGNAMFGGWFKWNPNELFICWPGDRDGLAHHPDWRARAHWQKTQNPLVQYLEFIRSCLTIPGRGYQARSSLPLAS